MDETAASPLLAALKKQKYHLIGAHSAVKRCKWLYESIVNNRPCYKQKFYGIQSHRCIQMTPSLYYCTQQCLFCWRAQSGDLQVTWDEMKNPAKDPPTLRPPAGDGSPMEEGAVLVVYPLAQALAMCARGEIIDLKTELILRRLRECVGE